MRYIGIFCFLFVSFAGWSQPGEEIGPLTGNPVLMARNSGKNYVAKAAVSFDSTFIYTADTIALPVFDDFSSDKFQAFDVDYNDPGVTSVLEYRLLDTAGAQLPLPSNYLATEQPTFRTTYNQETSQASTTPFAGVGVYDGDFSSYPTSYELITVYPPYYINDTIPFTGGTDADPDTIWIVGAEVYQDSARQFFAHVSDPSAIWLDKNVYRNYSMAKDPWSLGVATFDGLDEFGYPYAINTTTTGFADYLTSKPIDMSGVSAADSIYFSFVFQAQGLADPPEAGDSLILEFYSSSLDQWNRVWGTNGIALDSFRVGHILIDNPNYFTDAFQFRFTNFGGLSGSLDHFHIDYVNLRSVPGFGGASDTLLRDIAFSYPIYTLLEEYTSVPWDHYKNLANPNDVMSDAVQVVMANSFPTEISANDGTTEIYHGGNLEGSVTMVSDVLCNNVNDNYFALDIPYSSHDFRSFYTFDQAKPGISQDFEVRSVATGGATNFFGNDSTIFNQQFRNYYSYDDGSAEAAYGPTGIQSRLAIQYTPYEADSLIGAMIHFVPSVTDVSNNLFFLTVWDDDNGQPGNVIYEDDIFFPRTPTYHYGHNMFAYYLFKDTMKVPVDGTFYIGWRQLDPERLNVGLDRNIVSNQHTFFSVDGEMTWEQSTYEGSVMLRPIFSTEMDVTLGIQEIAETKKSKIYPNPTENWVTIQPAVTYTGATLRNMQGQVVLNIETIEFNMDGFPAGMYFLEIEGEETIHKISKL